MIKNILSLLIIATILVVLSSRSNVMASYMPSPMPSIYPSVITTPYPTTNPSIYPTYTPAITPVPSTYISYTPAPTPPPVSVVDKLNNAVQQGSFINPVFPATVGENPCDAKQPPVDTEVICFDVSTGSSKKIGSGSQLLKINWISNPKKKLNPMVLAAYQCTALTQAYIPDAEYENINGEVFTKGPCASLITYYENHKNGILLPDQAINELVYQLEHDPKMLPIAIAVWKSAEELYPPGTQVPTFISTGKPMSEPMMPSELLMPSSMPTTTYYYSY